jgi:hypothetical protein
MKAGLICPDRDEKSGMQGRPFFLVGDFHFSYNLIAKELSIPAFFRNSPREYAWSALVQPSHGTAGGRTRKSFQSP